MRLFVVLLLFISFLWSAIDINNATLSQLLEINGIGKAKAAKIIKYREQNQCFSSIDELSNIEGISKKLVNNNRSELTLGVCPKSTKTESIKTSSYKDVVLEPVNLVFVAIIFILAFVDIKTKKDFKSQIVSVGVLGTFVGVFIGLQGFNPDDIMNSVNKILVGLKTAFFTSIVGMSVALILTIIQKLKDKPERK